MSVILISTNGTKQKIEAKHCNEYEVDQSTKTEKLGSPSINANNLVLENGKCFKFEIEAKPGQFVENSEITVNSVELSIGTEKIAATLLLQKSLNAIKYFQSYNIHLDHLEFIKILRTCYVIPTFHLNSNVLHNQPMLLNEYYKLHLTLSNNHDDMLQNVNVKLSLPQNYKNKGKLKIS